jgi:hypothetical protein
MGQANATYNSHQHDKGSEGFLSQIVKVDEILVKYFEPESKLQAIKWRHMIHARKQKFKKPQSAGKIVMTEFWDGKDVILVTYLLRRYNN